MRSYPYGPVTERGYYCTLCGFDVEGHGAGAKIMLHIIEEHHEIYDLVMKVDNMDDLIKKFADSGVCRGFNSYTTKKRGYVREYDTKK
uniref:LAGLIDADG homing endonuclease n=1 Tax=Ditylenchus dipsaci TaxID=166011 RepID=A0A915CNL0_9BILA